MSDSSTIEQDRIEENLQRTRSRMDRRLNELQGKLAPGQIFEDLLDYVRGNGGAEFGQKLMASVQKNPLPAVVAGVGIAWLMASDFRPQPAVIQSSSSGGAGFEPYSSGTYDFEQRMREAEAGVQRDATDTDDSYGDRLEDARGKVLGVARQAQDTAASFAQRVQAAMGSAKDSATRSGHDLRDRASGMASQVTGSAQQLGGQMRDSAQQMGSQLRDSAQQAGGQLAQGARSVQQSSSDMLASITGNPMALGAMGLAAGALIGLLLPQSEQEEAAFGGVAGQARDAARNMAQSVVDQGSGLARQVMDTARESAAAHGFTTDKSLDQVVGDIKSGDIIENAKQVAHEVLNAGHQAMQKNAGSSSDTPPTPDTPPV